MTDGLLPWMSIDRPAELSSIPTMLSRQEQQLLHWLARDCFAGQGKIIDAGSFLGGSTAAFATGLAARTDAEWDAAVVVFDQFIADRYAVMAFSDYIPIPVVGFSFRERFDEHVAPWSRYLDVREGDLTSMTWGDEPIEILFLDILKEWRLNDFALANFFPCLTPGRSIIVQQDYLWGYGPWIHITMELMADSVEMFAAMRNGTVAYRLVAPIPADLIGAKLRTDLTDKHKRQLMDRAVNRWSGEERGLVELAKVWLIAETDVDEARAELQCIKTRYADQPHVLYCAGVVTKQLPQSTPELEHRDPRPLRVAIQAV